MFDEQSENDRFSSPQPSGHMVEILEDGTVEMIEVK